MPGVELLGLALVGEVEDVEALLKVEDLPHSLEVHEQLVERLLVEEDAGAPASRFQGVRCCREVQGE